MPASCTERPTFDGVFAYTCDADGFALSVQDDKGFDGFFIAAYHFLDLGPAPRFGAMLSMLGGSNTQIFRQAQRRQQSLPALQRTAQCD